MYGGVEASAVRCPFSIGQSMADNGVLVRAAAEDDVLARARRKALYERLDAEQGVRLGEDATRKIRSWMIRNRKQMRPLFASLDRNGDGTLTIEEVVRGLQSINDSGLSVQEIHAAIVNMDTDGSGDLDYHEFVEHLGGAGEDSFEVSVPRVHTLASMGHDTALLAELGVSGGASSVVNGLHTTKSNWRGRTPLMTASFSGQLSTVKTLIANRGDPNCRDTFGWTALMGAAVGGHAEVCRALCRAGATPELRNTSGQTAGDLAKLYGFGEVTDALLPYSDRDGAGVPGFLRPLDRPR